MRAGFAWLVLIGVTAVGCQAPSGASPMPSVVVGAPEPSPAPAPETPASPSPAPPPTPAPNLPPSVSLRGGGDCHPSAAGSQVGPRACRVTFEAVAEDPDGDPLAYAWSGCASGSGRDAECEIRELGLHRVEVSVSDGHGGTASATGTARGVDAPPAWGGDNPRVLDPAPSGTLYLYTGGQPEDPDGDEDPNTLCARVGFSVSGPCRAGRPACGGVGDVFDVDFTTLTGPGICVFVATTHDSWGAEGRFEIRFEVRRP